VFPTVEVFDVSLPLSEQLAIWPGDPKLSRTLASSIARGDIANVSHLDLGAHTGTHVDAPFHFVDSMSGIDQLPLDALIGPCLVVEANPPGPELRPQDLPETEHRRILFKTRNSARWASSPSEFDRDFVGVGLELAVRLVQRQVLLVGVDYLSVEPFDAPRPHPVHVTLLEARIVVVEGLDLSRVEPGEYELFCLPLKLVGSDGAPARTVLVRRSTP